MKEIVKKAVENSVTGFLQGKVNDSLINNVMLCWHGECGSLAEACVVVTRKGDDGRFKESDGYVVTLREYVNNVKYKNWYNLLVKDLTVLVMDLVDPDPGTIMDNLLEDMRKQVYNMTKI